MSEPPAKQQKTDGEQPTETVPGESRAAMQSTVSKETPILIPPTITYGLQDTHTTILPVLSYCTAVALNNDTSVTLNIGLNTIYDILTDTTFSNLPTSGSGNASKGLYSKRASAIRTFNYNTMEDYPTGITQNTNPEPWWRSYWEKIYNYYSVIGCHYEIVLYNASKTDILVAHSVRTYGTQYANFLPSNVRLSDITGQKQINYTNVKGERYGTNPNTEDIITGYYKPGQAKRDVANDGDVKLWTQITATPSYKEQLSLHFFKHPLAPTDLSSDDTKAMNVNIQIRLKYTVQFKQLKSAGAYPLFNALNLTQTLPAHANPFVADP